MPLKTRAAICFGAKKPSPLARNLALVCLWCGRLVYGRVIAKFSRMGCPPHFLTHGVRYQQNRCLDAETAAFRHIFLSNHLHCLPPPHPPSRSHKPFRINKRTRRTSANKLQVDATYMILCILLNSNAAYTNLVVWSSRVSTVRFEIRQDIS